ncbi:MAG: magnesium transporter [Egibacteraceae bacterium]
MPRPVELTLALLRRISSHWARERTTLRQGFTAIAICIGVTLAAGLILAGMENLLERLPGLLVLVPAAIGMRGAIFGALGARLGTGILVGQYTPGFEPGTFTRSNVEAAGLLTVATALLSALVAFVAATLLGSETIPLTQLVIVSTVSAALSSVLVLFATLGLARTAQTRSWDMDAIGAPIISATADLTSLPALVVGALIIGFGWLDPVLAGLLVLGALAAAVFGLRHPERLARRIFSESLPVLSYTAVADVLAGLVLETRLETLVTSPALLVVVPPFIAVSGALGGILSARLASQLHLGLLEPTRLPRAPAMMEGSITVLFALAGFFTLGVLAWLLAAITGIPSPGLVRMLVTTLVGGLLATGAVFGVGYYAATASYRFGLDPDNSSIPIVTASMDFLGIVCLIVGIAVAGAN